MSWNEKASWTAHNFSKNGLFYLNILCSNVKLIVLNFFAFPKSICEKVIFFKVLAGWLHKYHFWPVFRYFSAISKCKFATLVKIRKRYNNLNVKSSLRSWTVFENCMGCFKVALYHKLCRTLLVFFKMVSINVIVFVFLKILHNRFHAKAFAGKSGFEIRHESASLTHADTCEEHFNESLFRLAWIIIISQKYNLKCLHLLHFNPKIIRIILSFIQNLIAYNHVLGVCLFSHHDYYFEIPK